jgi:hypothetical protein
MLAGATDALLNRLGTMVGDAALLLKITPVR